MKEGNLKHYLPDPSLTDEEKILQYLKEAGIDPDECKKRLLIRLNQIDEKEKKERGENIRMKGE